MLTPYSVNDMLRDPALEKGWEATLAEWETAAHSQVQATLAYVRGLRNQLLNVTKEIDSMEELERILALGYLDLKCQWAILNVQIQYAAAHRGEIREDLMYRATCVSQLLEAVESLLSPSDVDAMTQMIAEPVANPGATAVPARAHSQPPAAPRPAPPAPPARPSAPIPGMEGTAVVARPQAARPPQPPAAVRPAPARPAAS